MNFTSVIQNVIDTSKQVNCTGAGLMILHKGETKVEEYWGTKSKDSPAGLIEPDTQFHIASVRKAYIGFAVAYAVHHGFISSIDDSITDYLSLDAEVYKNITIRHCLTHTHGLLKENQYEFTPGTNWAYRGAGIELLADLVKKTTGQTIAEVLQKTVFEPLQLKETGWYGKEKSNFADVIDSEKDPHWYTSENTDGSQMNMYVSIRDLAKWGQFHLQKGRWNSKQLVDKEIIEMATSIQSPKELPSSLPQNGYLWFVQKAKGIPSNRMELSLRLPAGSYQLLGYTNVTLLVIPQYEIVAVRAFNSFGSPPVFSYLQDVRSFGDEMMNCLEGNT